jgi:hypothetical protein
MQIPECFHNRVVEEVVDQHVSLDNEGKLITDGTRAKIVKLIDDNRGDMTRIVEELLRIEYRLKECLPILNPEGNILRMMNDDKFRQFLRSTDPAKVFAEFEKQLPDESMTIRAAQTLGMGHREILKDAIRKAAEQAGCTPEIQALIDEIRPRIKAEIAEEMGMPIAERITKKGY